MKGKILFWLISTTILDFVIGAEAIEKQTCSHCSKPVCPTKRGTSNSVSDFGDLTRCTTFVDKTMMIEAFFNNTASGQYHLITAPHKFGRTTNLNMLKRFVEMTVNGDGDVKEKEEAGTYNMFTNVELKLKIAPALLSESQLYYNHFHSYPVIYVSFKDVVGDSYEGIVKGLRENIKTCFQSYEWLYRKLQEDVSNDEESFPTASRQMELMKAVLHDELDEDDIEDCLSELTKILFDFFDYQHVFVLIDDYDSPIMNAIEHNLNLTRVYGLMEKIYAKLFNSDHRYIKFAVLTGTMNVLSKAKFSNVKHWNFLDDHDFVNYYGFTDKEVDVMLDKHGITHDEQNLVKKYYGGYVSFHSQAGLYNPYSITKYVCNREPQKDRVLFDTYWPEAGQVASCLQRFKKNKKYGDILLQLLVKKTITFPLWTRFNGEELNELRRMMHEEKLPLTDFHADLFLSYLFANGYLSHTDVQNIYAMPSTEIENYVNRLFMKTPKRELANSGEIRNKLSHEPSLYRKIWDKLFG